MVIIGENIQIMVVIHSFIAFMCNALIDGERERERDKEWKYEKVNAICWLHSTCLSASAPKGLSHSRAHMHAEPESTTTSCVCLLCVNVITKPIESENYCVYFRAKMQSLSPGNQIMQHDKLPAHFWQCREPFSCVAQHFASIFRVPLPSLAMDAKW